MLVVWRQIFFCSLENVRIFANRNGKMAERSNAAVLKTVDLHGSGGSNPSLSARKREKPSDLLDFSLLFFKGLWTGDVGSLYGIPNQCRPYPSMPPPILYRNMDIYSGRYVTSPEQSTLHGPSTIHCPIWSAKFSIAASSEAWRL